MMKPMEALAAAHDAGIVHRDLKPSNIYVCGERLEHGVPVKVLDFLLAKCDDEGVQGQAVSFMTPDYAAPEQFLGVEALIGPWTDVFSLALVLVEMMLGGRSALRGDDFASLKRASLDAHNRPTPASFGLDVPNAVESVFKRALAVDARNRFENAGKFLNALQRAVEAHGRLTSTGLSRVSGQLFHDPSAELKRRRGTRESTGRSRRPQTGETVVAPTPVQTGYTVIAPIPKFDFDD
jgi:serine/threonine protein kinase